MYLMQMHGVKQRDEPAYLDVVKAFSVLDVDSNKPGYPEYNGEFRR